MPTDSFTQVDFGAEWTPSSINGLKVSALIRNATDEEIRWHTSAIKDLVPESGRDIRLSLGFSSNSFNNMGEVVHLSRPNLVFKLIY